MLNEIFARAGASSSPAMLSAVAGILAAQQLPELPPAWVAPALAFFASVLLMRRRLRLPALFLLGLAWALIFAAARMDEKLAAALERQDLTLEGTVASLPQTLDDGIRFDFHLSDHSAAAQVPVRIRLGWYREYPALKAGERWRLRVRLKRPHGFFNPGSFDYEAWLFAHGIGATGYVRPDPVNARLAAADSLSVGGLRQRLYDRILAVLDGSPMRGIVAALAMGEEGGISQEQWEVLRRTGTAHLVAISGSHIGLIAGLTFFLALRVLAFVGLKRWPPPALAAAIATAAALAYAALADFAIPTQRALVMVAVVMGGIIVRRNLRPTHTLCLALLAVSAWDPLAVLAPGFWLSFAAVGLILFAVTGRLSAPGFWQGLLRMNWVTALGLFPLLLLFFQQVSLISPLANLIAIPAMGMLAIPWCLLGSLVLLVHEHSGGLILSGAAYLLHGAWLLLEWFSALPAIQWRHAQPPGWSLIFAVPGILLLLAPRGIPGRWLGVLLLAPAVSVMPKPVPPSGLRLTLLDVGQGLSAVVQTQAHTLVFDTGARFGPGFDIGSAVLEPFLLSRDIRQVDALVVSHGDNDHLGGAQSLLERMPVALSLSSVPDRLPGAGLCHAGQKWEWDGARFEMLSPFGDAGNDNNQSCVLKVTVPGGCVLLTGDIERAAEARLVDQYGKALRCDVLIAPHHGSRTSSTPPFVDAVRPRHALISAGYLNPYGLPAKSVVERYRQAGVTVLNTADLGALPVEIDPAHGLQTPTGYRLSHGHYWNDRPGD